MSDKRISLRIVGTTPTDAEFEAARQRAAEMFSATIKAPAIRSEPETHESGPTR